MERDEQTEFFVIPKNPNFEKIKKKKNSKKPHLHHFTKVYQKSGSYVTLFLRYNE